MPPELQSQVHAVVQETKRRSGWPVRRTLRQLGVSPASYYRWRKEAQGAKALSAEPVRPVQAYEATDEEKRAVRAYALKHAGIRHRELAWRMVDEEVAWREHVDGVPDSQGRESGVSVDEEEEADPGGRGEGEAAG